MPTRITRDNLTESAKIAFVYAQQRAKANAAPINTGDFLRGLLQNDSPGRRFLVQGCERPATELTAHIESLLPTLNPEAVSPFTPDMTEAARIALRRAGAEMRRHNYHLFSDDFLLYGLFTGDTESIAYQVFRDLGIDVKRKSESMFDLTGFPSGLELALERAAIAGDINEVKRILALDVYVDSVTFLNDKTTLEIAAEYGHKELYDYLLSQGAKPAIHSRSVSRRLRDRVDETIEGIRLLRELFFPQND